MGQRVREPRATNASGALSIPSSCRSDRSHAARRAASTSSTKRTSYVPNVVASASIDMCVPRRSYQRRLTRDPAPRRAGVIPSDANRECVASDRARYADAGGKVRFGRKPVTDREPAVGDDPDDRRIGAIRQPGLAHDRPFDMWSVVVKRHSSTLSPAEGQPPRSPFRAVTRCGRCPRCWCRHSFSPTRIRDR